MEPTLERRLRDADPLTRGTDSDEAHDQEWLGETARSAIIQGPRARRPRAIIIGAVAAAALIAAAAGGLMMRGSDDASGGKTEASAMTVTELDMAPDTLAMSSCIPFSVDTLSGMPVAFSGEVTERTPDYVLITVDNWYRGPDSDRVRLLAPDMSMTSLGDVVDFREGSRYLVTATDGTVNYCGFSGQWSQELANGFADAFGR